MTLRPFLRRARRRYRNARPDRTILRAVTVAYLDLVEELICEHFKGHDYQWDGNVLGPCHDCDSPPPRRVA